MTTNTINRAAHSVEYTDENPAGLAGLMRAPWALSVDSYNNIQAIYAAHGRGPKLDIKAVEDRLGFPLAPPRENYVTDRGVAVIQIDGLIAPKASLLTRVCGATSAQWATEQLKSAMADPAVKAIVLAIDSPGGSVHGSPELAAAVFEAAQKKPLVAHSDAMLMSAAYWIGSAANAVYISGPTVQAGSIGIVASHRHDPASSLGTTEIVAGRYKRITTSLAPLSADGAAYMQDQVNHIYGVFVTTVAKHRGVSPEVVNERMAEGRTFIGQQAIDAGLVDEIMPLRSLVNAMASNPAAFANRRRLAARRVNQPGANAFTPQNHSAALAPVVPRVMSREDQAVAAVSYSKEHGITIVQALKALGFAT